MPIAITHILVAFAHLTWAPSCTLALASWPLPALRASFHHRAASGTDGGHLADVAVHGPREDGRALHVSISFVDFATLTFVVHFDRLCPRNRHTARQPSQPHTSRKRWKMMERLGC
jgi:hypothetical protein